MTSEQQARVLDVFKESGIYRTIGGRNCSYTDEGFKEFLAENAGSEANSEMLRWRIQIESELASKAFNKGKAVERLCEFLGVSRADTIAVGDSMNDLEMIRAVEIGVCMENGSPSLKKIADMVCPSVTEDGLYSAFEKLRLI